MQDSNIKSDLPKGYVPSDKEQYMNSEMLEYFKVKLLAWKNRLIQESNDEQAAIISKTSREPDHVDEATLAQDRSIDLFIADKDLNLIHEIEHALKRIEDNEYGFCENTGDQIGVRRLDAWPIARLTVKAQEKLDRIAQL